MFPWPAASCFARCARSPLVSRFAAHVVSRCVSRAPLRCAPVLRTARRVVCSSPASVFSLGFWPLRGLGLVLPAPRGLRLPCAPPASPFRCAVLVPCVTCFSFRCASWFSSGLRPGPCGPSLVFLVHRWCRLRRAVRWPECLACWLTECLSGSGAAPRPLHLRRRWLRRRLSCSSRHHFVSPGCCAPRFSIWSALVNDVFDGGFAPGRWSLHGLLVRRGLRLRRAVTGTVSSAVRWMFLWGCAPSRSLLVDGAKNGMGIVHSVLVEDTVKNRTGVANRPQDHPLRSNPPRGKVHHEEELYEPTPRAAGIPQPQSTTKTSHPHHRGAAPTTSPTSTHPLCVQDTHPPAAGQTPPHTKGAQQNQARWHPLPAAGVLKARCKRHTR